MAEEGPSEIVAPPPTEFNKNLRCCITCRLIKTRDQFYDHGCENCVFLEMAEDNDRIEDCTTTEFQGMIAVVDPATSWAGKWTHHRKHVPGCYALSVPHADVPQHILELVESQGITIRQDDD